MILQIFSSLYARNCTMGKTESTMQCWQVSSQIASIFSLSLRWLSIGKPFSDLHYIRHLYSYNSSLSLMLVHTIHVVLMGQTFLTEHNVVQISKQIIDKRYIWRRCRGHWGQSTVKTCWNFVKMLLRYLIKQSEKYFSNWQSAGEWT